METLVDISSSETQAGQPPTKRRGRRLKVLVAGVVVVPVAAVAVAWGLFFTPDSPAELRLSTQPTDTASDVPTGLWSVGQGSVAGYRVREKLLRLPASNDAVGRTSAITGAFRLTGDRDVLRVEKGLRIEADLSKLKSDDDRRDDHMRTMGIETDLFPTASFVTTSDLVLPAALTAGGRASVTLPGDLTVHGVTRSVAIPLQAQHAGGRIEVVGSLTFPWELFDMKQPNLSYVTVEADPTLELQVFFDHESTPPVPVAG